MNQSTRPVLTIRTINDLFFTSVKCKQIIHKGKKKKPSNNLTLESNLRNVFNHTISRVGWGTTCVTKNDCQHGTSHEHWRPLDLTLLRFQRLKSEALVSVFFHCRRHLVCPQWKISYFRKKSFLLH